jgi:hypothetical protein
MPFIDFKVEGLERFGDRVKSLSPRVAAVVYTKINQLVLQLQGKVLARLNLTTHRRTGILAGSIRPDLAKLTAGSTATNWTIRGSVRAGDPPLYARFIEYGTSPHDIFAVKARALRFIGRGGEQVFRRSVHHPGIKPREFMFSTYAEEKDRIENELRDAVNGVIQGK